MFTFKLINHIVKVQISLKMFNFNKKKILTNSNREADIISSMEIPKELGKNKWLYPADEFLEKWKEPKIHKSKTFEL